MRHHLLCLALGATACASSQSASPSTGVTQQTFAIAGDAGAMTITRTTTAQTSKFARPVDDVWTVLPAVLDSLGVKPTLIDPAQHAIGIEQSKIRVRLGTTPLSRYLDCGSTQVGPNADSYEVLLTVMSRVTATANGSQVGTLVDAYARPVAFRQNYSACSTTGLLETRIANGVKRRLQP